MMKGPNVCMDLAPPKRAGQRRCRNHLHSLLIHLFTVTLLSFVAFLVVAVLSAHFVIGCLDFSTEGSDRHSTGS